MEIDYGKLATHHMKAFSAMIYHLIEEENITFDLIIGSGNTGILSAKFTEMIYKKLNKEIPPILQVPVLRYKGEEKPENLFDNSVLYPEVESFLKEKGIKKLQNILFVDDEIYGGNAAKACMKLIIEYKSKHNFKEETSCYIVAEDQGMSEDFSIPDVETKFYPFAKGIDGTSNVITYFLPYELENPIKDALENQISDHVVINILLGLPIREKGTIISMPRFSYKHNNLAKEKLSQLSDLQRKAYEIVNLLIDEGLKEYKEGKIIF